MQVLVLGWLSLSVPSAILLGFMMRDRSQVDFDAALIKLCSETPARPEPVSVR